MRAKRILGTWALLVVATLLVVNTHAQTLHQVATSSADEKYHVWSPDGSYWNTDMLHDNMAISSNPNIGEWIQNPIFMPFECPNRGFGCVTYDDFIYILGGDSTGSDQSDGSMYYVGFSQIQPNGSLGNWIETTNIPIPLWETEAIRYENFIYIIAGYNTNAPYNSNFVYKSEINADGTLRDWQLQTSLPSTAYGHTAVIDSNRVYVLGDWFNTSVYFAGIDENGNLGNWNSTTSLPLRLYASDAIIYDNKLFLFGGKEIDGDNQTIVSTVRYAEIFSDGQLSDWQITNPMPEARWFHQVVNSGDRVFVVGGSNYDGNVSNVSKGLINNDNSFTWETIDPIPDPTSGNGLVINGNYLYYLAGAWSNSTYYSDISTSVHLGLVAYYPFNGNANDESSNGNNGKVNGATLTTDRFGNANSAYSFNRNNQNYINCGNDISFDITNQITLGAWIKPVDVGFGILIGKRYEIYYLRFYNNSLNFYLSGCDHMISYSSSNFDINKWYFITATYDGDNMKLYVDGVNVISEVETDKILTGDDPLVIGGSIQGCYFNGTIDEVNIYNRALTQSEIDSLYNIGGWPPPDTPQNLSSTPGNQKVTLRWNQNTESDLHKYNIYRDTLSPATTLIDSVVDSPPDTFYTDTGLMNGQIYYYRITAVDSIGNESGYSDEVSATPYQQYTGPVWHVSTSGSDETGDGSENNPFATIQHGIDATIDGDTVLVATGTYVENINFNGKNIVVISTDGPEVTIIDGNQDTSVVIFNSGETSSAVLSGFTIQNGSAHYGGGIYCNNSSPSLENVVVSGNMADSGGGINCRNNSNPSFVNMTVRGNMADWEGGGIFCHSSSPNLENVKISENTADISGGGVCFGSSSPTLKNVTVSGNTASSSGGGILCANNSSPSLENVTVSLNAANYAGGIYFWNNSSPTLMNVTIGENTADINGGGIRCSSSSPSLVNTILWNNSPQEIYFSEYEDPSSITIAYSDVQGGQDSIVTNDNGMVNWLKSNIDEDPIFVDAANDDYHLSDYSPCIGAGADSVQINGTWYYAPDTDIEGNPRPNPAGSNPDMGAYENSRATPIDIISPAPPQNLTAIPGPAAAGQVTLRWNQNTESDLHKYNIYRDTSSPATTLIDSVVGAPPDTFYIDTGLTNGQVYYYRVTAVDDAGNESEYSDEVSAIPNPVTIHVSTSGNDSNSGTASNPLRNIQTALSRANSGDTIKVSEGTYEEGLIPQNPVVLLGGYTDDFTKSERHRFNHKTIVQAVSSTILTDNKGCTVDGFVFDGNSVCDLGIKLTDGSVFTHNLVWRVNAFAAVSMETYGGAVVVNNTIVESGTGLNIYSGSGIPIFKNNIIAHTNLGVNTIGYSSAVRSYNNVFGNIYNYIGFDDTPGIGDISLNPQFVDRDNGDFRLQESSPCIDRGDPDAQYNDPDGSRNDIGVYYYFGEAPSAPTGLTATPGNQKVTLYWSQNTESDLHK
ncbi:MAG: DUF1565 domain-containing protein, partial [Candidatus Marinimicrobia bacterium]|nr:DUF1565 domain-containing protein [Candidatus Neomarinimicrobiota bacterium]